VAFPRPPSAAVFPYTSLFRSEALNARTPQLPVGGGAYAEFAADTGDALASGCEGAALALVERSLAEAGSTLAARPILLVHGGGADRKSTRLNSSHVKSSYAVF